MKKTILFSIIASVVSFSAYAMEHSTIKPIIKSLMILKGMVYKTEYIVFDSGRKKTIKTFPMPKNPTKEVKRLQQINANLERLKEELLKCNPCEKKDLILSAITNFHNSVQSAIQYLKQQPNQCCFSWLFNKQVLEVIIQC